MKNYFRNVELRAQRAQRDEAASQYRAGFDAGMKGEPAAESSAAYLTGFKDGAELRVARSADILQDVRRASLRNMGKS